MTKLLRVSYIVKPDHSVERKYDQPNQNVVLIIIVFFILILIWNGKNTVKLWLLRPSLVARATVLRLPG